MSNNKSINVVRIAGVAALAALCLCAKAPQKEVDEASAAFESTKSIGADKYAAEQFQQTQSKYDAAIAEINTQNGKSPIARNYTLAGKLLKEATESAALCKQTAEQNKGLMKTEAETMIDQAKKSAEEVTTLFNDTKKKKKAVEAVEPELTALNQLIEQASASLTNGDYLEARTTSQAAADKATAVKAGIDSLSAPSKKK